jgi:hypothetical protein
MFDEIKNKIFMVLPIIPLITNICWYFTQDAVITLSVHLGINLILLPFLISKVAGKNIYEILSYKGLLKNPLASDKKSNIFKIIFASIILFILAVFIVIFYFGLFPNLKSVTFLSAYFKIKWINYIYGLVVLVLVYFVATIEMKLFYGVIGTFLPDSILGYIIIALFQTSFWIAFSVVFFNKDALHIILFLVFAFAYYLLLYIVKEKDSYNEASIIHATSSIFFVCLCFVYVHLRVYSKANNGINVVLDNKGNLFNKLI